MANVDVLSYAGNIILAGGWISTAFVGGKKEYNKQLVTQLKDLVKAQGQEIILLKTQNDRQQNLLDAQGETIEHLIAAWKEVIGGDPTVVPVGPVPVQPGSGRRSGPANPASTGNGGV